MTDNIEPTDDLEKPVDDPVNPNESPDDPDYAALKAVEAEIENGKDGDKPEPAPEQAASPAPSASPEAAPDKQPVMVPIDAVHAARRQAQEWRDKAANYAGQLEAIKSFVPAPGAAGQEPAPAQKTPQERIADLEAELIAAGEKFESGEIGMAELLKVQRRVDDEVWTIRTEAAKPPTPEQKTEPEKRVDLYYEEKLAEIEQKHPYVALIKEDRHWDFLRDEAAAQIASKGIKLDPDNPQHDLLFRQTMAELTDVYGPQWTGKPAGAKQQPNGAPKPSPTAQARGEKLDLASRLPPDVGSMGGAGDGNDVWTDDRIATMTDEEWEGLPAATRAAIERRSGLAPPTS